MSALNLTQRCFILLMAAFLLVWTGCKQDPENPEPDPNTNPGTELNEAAELAKLADTWVRVLSNNPSQDGMKVTVSDDEAVVTDEASSNYSLGDVKWSAITPIAENEYTYEELGGDGNYYPAEIQLVQDTVFVEVGNSGSDNRQKWVREANYTPMPGGSTVTLDCSGFDPSQRLINVNNGVDYEVPSSCLLIIDADWVIDPGVVISFGSDAGILVVDGGSLQAVGTAAQPIVMQGATAVSGFWKGVKIRSNNPLNELTHVTIKHTGSNTLECCSNPLASLFVESGRVKLNQLTLREGDGAGLVVYEDAKLTEYNELTITGHASFAARFSLNRLGDIDGLASDYSGNDEDFFEVYDGNITTDLTWQKINIPYLVQSGVSQVSADIEIEAGTKITFASDAGLLVTNDGFLAANGTATDPIVMEGEVAARGYWRGLKFRSNNLANALDYTIIRHTGSQSLECCSNPLASVFVESGRINLRNVTLEEGAGAGLIGYKAAEFVSYESLIITGHDSYAAQLSGNRLGEMDGLGSDYSGNDEDYVYIYNGSIDDDITWEKVNVPYLLDESLLSVEADVTITPGTDITFGDDAGIIIRNSGSFNAVGTASARILFRPVIENGTAFWAGIHGDSNNPLNEISFADIDGAGSKSLDCCSQPLANLRVRAGQFTVTNCDISNSGGCGISVNLNGATLTESNNTFSNNANGGLCN